MARIINYCGNCGTGSDLGGAVKGFKDSVTTDADAQEKTEESDEQSTDAEASVEKKDAAK